MSKYLNENGVKILWNKTKEIVGVVDTKVDTVEAKVDTVEAKVDTVEAKVDEIQALSLDEINEILYEPALITFTVTDEASETTKEYQAEEGMTWKQWVDSAYNTSGSIMVAYNGIVLGGNMNYTNMAGGLPNEESQTQYGDTVILEGAAYVYRSELPSDWV